MFERGWYLFVEDWGIEQLEDLVMLALTFIFVSKRSMRKSEVLRDKATIRVTCHCIIQKKYLQQQEHGALYHVYGLFCDPDKGIPGFGPGFWGWLYCDDIKGTFCTGPVWPL